MAAIKVCPVGRVIRKKGKKVRGTYCEKQEAPRSAFAKGSFRTVVRQGGRVVLVTGCPKGEWSGKTCRVGTRAHKVLVRTGTGLGSLGQAVDPTVIGVAGAVGLALILFGRRGGAAEQLLPGAQPVTAAPKCGPAEVRQAYVDAAGGAASGAAVGAPGGPYGAAVGAGAGLALGFLNNRCGLKKFNEAKKALCKNADKLQRELEKRQAGIPGYDKLSCDQRIGILAVLGPAGVLTGVATGATIAGANIAKKAICRTTDRALAKLDNAGAKLPKGIEDWSCDQKAAFIVALGPLGVTAAFGGVLTGTLAINAKDEVARNFERAKSAVKDISKKLGIKVPEIKVGGTAGDIAKKIGLGGISPFGIEVVSGLG